MSTKVMRGYFLEKQSYVDLYAVIIDKKKYRTTHMNLMVTLDFGI